MASGAPESCVSAALVEGRKFIYLYGQVPVSAKYGEQQVRWHAAWTSIWTNEVGENVV